MSTVAGQLTTHAGTSIGAPPPADTAQVREMLGMMKATLGQLDQTFRTLNEQSAKVSKLGPSMQSAATQIQALRHQIRKQDRKQELRVQEVKTLIQEQLKEKLARDMQSFITEEIKRETAIQVKEQVGLQLREHLPYSLEDQLVGSQKQLIEVKQALVNSEARRTNSNLRQDNLNDPLEVVLRPDGTKSAVYPVNLNSLFYYSPEMLKRLLRDYSLQEDSKKEKNLNRFMSHIGIQFQLIPIPS
ncbi:hypothetical protein NLI96_g5912 [Meripilus lineatus]|uniref:Uncharacterized protein n=1 Tax=Meripilus lineatus TaxID=2056292 RepID=A0AAD5V6X3_9APHY|nr:hypothetical protein NLI96_g5912 [Physisporinus lineatus]